jgi:AcrR family transcriptional regulator
LGSLRQKKKDRTRSEILAAAAWLFGEGGLQGTTMDDIAEGAEVSVATLYNYFGSKTALLVGIFESEAARMLDAGADVLAATGDDPVAAVQRLFDGYIAFMLEIDPELLGEALAAGVRNDNDLGHALFDLDMQLVTQLAELLEVFRTRGLLADGVSEDEATTLLFSAFITPVLMYLAAESIGPGELAARIHRLVEVAFAGLRADGTRARW